MLGIILEQLIYLKKEDLRGLPPFTRTLTVNVIALNLGRRAGHTSAMLHCAKPGDLIVTSHSKMRQPAKGINVLRTTGPFAMAAEHLRGCTFNNVFLDSVMIKDSMMQVIKHFMNPGGIIIELGQCELINDISSDPSAPQVNLSKDKLIDHRGDNLSMRFDL